MICNAINVNKEVTLKISKNTQFVLEKAESRLYQELKNFQSQVTKIVQFLQKIIVALDARIYIISMKTITVFKLAQDRFYPFSTTKKNIFLKTVVEMIQISEILFRV